jgi:hypothetical protein
VKRRADQEKGGVVETVKDGDRGLFDGEGCLFLEKHIERKIAENVVRWIHLNPTLLHS